MMANGKVFNENALTCATRLYPLGTILRISSSAYGKSVICKVTDRIAKKYATTRIDLSLAAMSTLGGKQALDAGLVKVQVERIK